MLCVSSTAQAQSPAPERTVAAQGAASVKVIAPKDRTHEGPIHAAVEAAEAKALPRAIADARSKATELARLSGLTLGPIVAISDAPISPYGPFIGFYSTVRARSLLRDGPHDGVQDRQDDRQARARGDPQRATSARSRRPSCRPSP